MKKRQFIQISAGIAGTVTATTMLKAFDTPVLAQNGVLADTPDGYNGFLVYMANGYVPPAEFFMSGLAAINFFHKGVMKFTDSQIEAQRQQAITFFAQRFGIDSQNQADYLFIPFALDPRNNYRAYVVGGEKVPSSGWVVRDGGWGIIVNNPNGVILGGEFSGVRVPAGTMFLSGDYNILTTKRGPDGRFQEIIISYEAGNSAIPSSDGSLYFRCDLNSKKYGVGKAQGVSAPVLQTNGLQRSNIRNILTFSGDNGF